MKSLTYAMAKRDIKITPVPEGWHLTGFLDTVTGAKLDAVLRSNSAPRGADDERPVAQRRVEAFDELLTSVIEHGLPVDRGIRPHLSVRASAARLPHLRRRPHTHPPRR